MNCYQEFAFPAELICYEGDGVPTPPAPAPPAPAPPEPTPPEPTPPEPTPPEPTGKGGKAFSQEDLNRFLAEDRRKHSEKYDTLKDSYETALANQDLTVAEREKLQSSYDDLRKQFRTKEQEVAEKQRELEDKYQKDLESARTAATTWEQRFRESTISRSLQDAAVNEEAYNPSQIVTILRGQTKLVEQLDTNGKSTGEFAPMVDMTQPDEVTGDPVQTQRTPIDAIKYMKEQAEFGNLFKANVNSGLGGNSATGGLTPGKDGKVDTRSLTTEQYMKIRKENPALLGL